MTTIRRKSPIFPREIPAKIGKVRHKLIESKLVEVEEKTHSNIVPFPTSAPPTDGDSIEQRPEVVTGAATIAQILKLEHTPALERIVADYLQEPGMSLAGEADAAREWIDDPLRNQNRKRMNLTFFRNWLKREQESITKRQSLHPPAQASPSPTSSARSTSGVRRNLMNLETDYRQKKTHRHKEDTYDPSSTAIES